MLYPLKFTPIIKEKIWGGTKLANKNTDNNLKADKLGESWELSGVEDNLSVVTNGNLKDNNIQELIEVYMGDLVGDTVYEKYGIEIPLLIKYIDANDNLSIQVHPDDKIAKERHKAYGKTEMWYIVDATPNARLIVGFNKPCDKAEYLTRLNNGTLEEIMNSFPVSKGDCVYIPAGTVHAICSGCYIAEIQQTSDITYRIYDYNRLGDDGKPRELHTDLARDVIDFTYEPKRLITYSDKINQTEQLVKCNYFTTNVVNFDKEIEKDYINIDSFVVYMCIEGDFSLVYDDNQSIVVKKGETILLPACFKNIFLIPQKGSKVKLLEIYIP